MTRTLKRYLGCVYRDIQRIAPQADAALQELLHLAARLLAQKRHDSNKLYSMSNGSGMHQQRQSLVFPPFCGHRVKRVY